jgi:hypothetical protein
MNKSSYIDDTTTADHDYGDRNKAKSQDESVANVADCDDNEFSGTLYCFPSTAFSH